MKALEGVGVGLPSLTSLQKVSDKNHKRSLLGIEILPVRNDVVDTRPESEDEHEGGGCEGYGQEIGLHAEELIDHGLGDAADDAGDLRAGLDLTQHIGGNDDAAGARNHETDRGDGKLAENDDHKRPEKDV